MLLEVNGIAIRTLALEVNPDLLGRLKSCFSDGSSNAEFIFDGSVQLERNGRKTLQGKIHRLLPMVHFMSILVFEDEHHDPLLVIEINFDGEPGALWPALDDCLGTPLRKILQCTKRPRSRLSEMYDAVLYSNDSLPIAPYLEAVANIPLTPYRGARGMSRQRILNEQELYNNIQVFLADGNNFQGQKSSDVFRKVKKEVSENYPETLAKAWGDPEPWNASKLLDTFYLFTAVFFVIWSVPILFGLPVFVALLLAQGMTWKYLFFLTLATPLMLLFILQGPAEDLSRFTINRLTKLSSFPVIKWLHHSLVNTLLAYLICSIAAFTISLFCLIGLLFLLAIPSLWFGLLYIAGVADSFPSWFSFFSIVGNFYSIWQYVFPSAFFGVTVLWIWLRFREVSDSTHDGGKVKPEILKKMEERENYVMHNHMGSLLTVKPGILRYILNRVNHWLLRSLARTFFRSGELGSMRTIHFAHWALIENGNRLLFLSNFDGTWESYLDDFTVKASKGVNLAWSQCIGFPFVRFLVFGGSESGALFKDWARHSMTESLFWYSAYPKLTVEMIHRNHRVTNGLRKGKLKDYEEWASDL